MIEFKGNLSKECMQFIVEYTWKRVALIMISLCIPFVIIAIIMGIIKDFIFLLILIPVALIVFLSCLKPGTKIYRKVFGKNGKNYDDVTWHIVIKENKIFAEGIGRYEVKYLKDIKKIVDMGNWYKLYFYFPHKSDLFVCQKSLLVQGTLTEFETLFKDKIIR